MLRIILRLSLALAFLAILPRPVAAAGTPPSPCPRPAAGSIVQRPPDLFSENGVLNVTFNYVTTLDSAGRTLFCLTTPDGLESPTLHVKPGDTLNVKVTNKVPAPPPGSPTEVVSNPSDVCGDATQTITSVNLHYHGTNTSPACHADQVIHTIINSGETFQYSLTFPFNEPPGLYWYHPHVHMLAEAAVQGGASGALIVEGIENDQPAVAGLPERIFVLRDQNVAGQPNPGGAVPAWDISINYVPIAYPALTPAIIKMQSGQSEFWRVSNSAADTIMDLQVLYDGVAQPLTIVGLDGVPVGSQDGTGDGHTFTETDVLLAPAARAEFIVAPPGPKVKVAQFVTLAINTGPDGDNDTQRTFATIETSGDRDDLHVMPVVSGKPGPKRFADLASVTPTARRSLYFSEVLQDPTNPSGPTNFFITVQGATPAVFSATAAPAITTTQGSVEDWTISNQALENHEFHMHQIHFLVMAVNGVPVPPDQQQYLDMIQIPFWDGVSPTFPSVTVRMDFRGMDIGDFVYHCHILGHEDNGMMAILRVLPPSKS